MKQRAEQAALDEPVLVAETPVELAIGVERRGDALQNPDQAREPAGSERKVSGADARRGGGPPVGRDWRGVDYCDAPVTTTLMSLIVVAAPSVARARRTYSPGFEKVAVTAALPESALAAGGLKATLAGPRQTNHDT